MARFTMDSGGLDSSQKVESYLYRLNQTLEYMFTHMDPEENFSEEARLIYVSNGEKQSSLEVAVDGIRLQMVDKDNIISAINLSDEGVQIKGDKISLEGVVTVNSYFKIGLDGSMYATNGHFSGAITASTIDIARGNDIGLYVNGNIVRLGDFEVNDGYGRQILESSDEVTGMSGEPNEAGQLYFWAGYYSDTNYVMQINNQKQVWIKGTLYVNNTDVMQEISDLWEAIGELEPEPPTP